jgi:cellulose synthase/poly-beta-1,6-N-acetylglucosamine synthase-like glycosyltransferase
MTALSIFNGFILVYFAVLNTFYLVLSVAAFRRLHAYVRRLKSLHIDDLVSSSGGLPMSLLVPAYNEAETIVDAIRSLLNLRYGDYEVIVVNDGSSDATLARLVAAFDLQRTERIATGSVDTEKVGKIYKSRRHPNLIVIDKANGGKADALNVGLNHSRGVIVAAMDADTLLEPDALARVVRPFLEDSSTVAVGGIIRVVNGCRVDAGSVEDIRLPAKMLPRFQVLEYLRAFLASRVGWDSFGATLIISGAFGAFLRSAVDAVGGFDTDSVGEDMELVVRLHRYHRDRDLPYRIAFLPDPVAWTEAPETLKQLGQQRSRWQTGLAQVLMRHRDMIGRRKYGLPGMVALPYFVAFELLAPIIELAGWVAFITALTLGTASPAYIFAYLALAVFLGSAFSVAAVALEELSFRRYRRFTDLLVLLGLALVETFGYRQLTLVWRLKGLVAAARKEVSWGEMERTGFARPVTETQLLGVQGGSS